MPLYYSLIPLNTKISNYIANMETPTTMNVPTPKTPTHMASRDDRLRIQTLYYTAGWTIDQIMLQNPRITHMQVEYALNNQPTPQQHLCGRHVLLDTPHRKQLVE